MQLTQISKSISLDPGDLPNDPVPALYVHVPFCFHKCHYCDFYSITRQTEERMDRYVDLLLDEASRWTADQSGPTPTPRTVFFGGGTPTLLPKDAMRRLIEGLRSRFDFSNLQEWTVEANPATVDFEYCAMLRELGVNRLSFGAQSFQPAELKILERHHDPDDVSRSVDTARRAGFSRLNVDLIYAIPGQTLDSWAKNLQRAIELNTPHVSCYGLTYEPNTPMAVKKRLGQIRGVEESIELEMFHYTRKQLAEASRPPYEISNYASEGEECRHNLIYWTGDNYIGLGPSAASHVSGHRWKNRPHLGEWETSIAGGQLPAGDIEHLTPEQRAGELAMLLLRLSTGLSFADYLARTGHDARRIFADPIDRLSRLELIEVSNAGFCLSDRGRDVSDSVAAEFLDPTFSSGSDNIPAQPARIA